MAEVKTATIESFQFQGACVECIPYGSGHINDTFRVTCDDNGTTRRYILQRMNKNIFLNPFNSFTGRVTLAMTSRI